MDACGQIDNDCLGKKQKLDGLFIVFVAAFFIIMNCGRNLFESLEAFL